ncbi:mannose-1-phosphate guanylyltransferase [Kineobactrum sediminis]|uniref:Mannose-1-phosphate guanylyltransferase n=1 Tax=Kineobactrum sediminis TaxID=1905677 RepID=A0A2N5XY44_9GAMM|nr:nucleotidyltransferase family protein [Kineobactrum sediminis]PLW81061.1 mannose-1-phosphate guanylyltransferase [Kineobactrum sediminis]
MKVMILAAGRGERMQPLTGHTPKPLLQAGGRPLIEYHILALAALGLRDLVVNVSHLAEQLMTWCGDGSRWGVRISYSHEPEPLETAGGIQRALPLLGNSPFLVINGDIWLDYASSVHPLAGLMSQRLLTAGRAHLLLVDNPPQHALGDFCLTGGGAVAARSVEAHGLTYAGAGVYTPQFFATMAPGKLPLRPLLDAAIVEGRLSGEYFNGNWMDIGTPERLRELDARLRATSAAKDTI